MDGILIGHVFAGLCRLKNNVFLPVTIPDGETASLAERPNIRPVSCIRKGVFMKNHNAFLRVALPVAVALLASRWNYASAQTDIPAGNVGGTWTHSNSPYQVTGEITIPNGETLTIEPGVVVVFSGHYKLNVQGRLLAVGTKEDTIVFTSQDPQVGWHGIRFDNTGGTNDSSKIIYCRLENGKANSGTDYDRCGGAIFIMNFKKVLISNCLIDSNMSNGNMDTTGGGGIALLGASPTITHCEFKANASVFGTAMVIWSSSKPSMTGNHFHDNTGHGTINIGAGSAPLLMNNLIENNHSPAHGIVHFSNGSGKAVLMNNTIVNNTCSGQGGAIFVDDGSSPLLMNDIVYGNEPAQLQLTVSSKLDFVHCLIEGGQNGFTGAPFSGTFQDCIDSNPLFLNSNDFQIQAASPCIGAGADSILVSKKWYYAPVMDFEENPRPNPVNSPPDIGAFESPLGGPLSDVDEVPTRLPGRIQLYPNYPNPFNPTTVIGYNIDHGGPVNLKVYDVLGREVAALVGSVVPAGYHEVEFSAENLAGGVYFCRIEAESCRRTRKMLLVR
jgi:predicted outer membrane repeat protein